MDEYIGIIKLFAGSFEIKGWAFCDGRLLPLSQYQALFSLIGTTYGGDGRTTFALPDLRSRVALGMGQGPGLGNYAEGQMSGTESVTLTVGNIPPHNHTGHVVVSSAESTDGTAQRGGAIATPGALSGRTFSSTLGYVNAAVTPDIPLSDSTVVTNYTGSGLPVSTMQPYLALNYIICLEGVYPSRS
ncbi:phage tail protein [Flavobacterium subsaxonicum]|uniref:Phage tail collar domain-containing protein n=1 Tax=Flavobacterium subsaxonicum WB 4.1-42 = DSM 21790 TaxID=1121898 RepID=A0A0A2MNM4_9FLAO|nr:tail fiber protein [Flavobacterium subsaxonicum]KGO93929.1 hypothetical protein Q766_05975 [Flavobacterium subsaxonicum WB 4.1-42 = DSM 21790]